MGEIQKGGPTREKLWPARKFERKLSLITHKQSEKSYPPRVSTTSLRLFMIQVKIGMSRLT